MTGPTTDLRTLGRDARREARAIREIWDQLHHGDYLSRLLVGARLARPDDRTAAFITQLRADLADGHPDAERLRELLACLGAWLVIAADQAEPPFEDVVYGPLPGPVTRTAPTPTSTTST